MKYEHEIITRQKYSFKIINYFQSRKGDDSWLRCNIKQYEASPLIKVNETNLDFGRQQTGDGSSHNKDGSSQETGGARRREQPRDRRGAGGMVALLRAQFNNPLHVCYPPLLLRSCHGYGYI